MPAADWRCCSSSNDGSQIWQAHIASFAHIFILLFASQLASLRCPAACIHSSSIP